MSKNIINRKRKQQQEYAMDSSSSSSSDTENVLVPENVVVPVKQKTSKKVKQKSATPSYHGEKNGTLQELCEKYGCANTLKCKGCSTIFDFSKRMRFHKTVHGTDLMYKCDHNIEGCKTTTYLVIKTTPAIDA